MDPTKPAIWILSILLALPLGIAANLITPMLVRWWSETSLARIEKRVRNLEKMRPEVAGTWHFTPAQWDIRNTVLIAALAIYAAVLFGVLLQWANTVGIAAIKVSQGVHASAVLAKSDAYGFLVALFLGLVFMLATVAWFQWKIGFPPFRSVHGPTALEELDREIEKLRKKAHEWQMRTVCTGWKTLGQKQ
jgi:hypothetical protein